MHLSKTTKYKKIFAFGISGDEKHHRISPFFISERQDIFKLPEIESLIWFNENSIEEYYRKEVLKEQDTSQKELDFVIKSAKELHKALRIYGALEDANKPLVVAGILLALEEIEQGTFKINSLNGKKEEGLTDGDLVYQAIEKQATRMQVEPKVKRDKLLLQFTIVKEERLNIKNDSLGKTPLKYFVEYIHDNIFTSIKKTSSAIDFLGSFYSEFMSYSGGDGQTLGIILTPRHITELFCDILDLKPTDKVLDPCCGSGGFLVAAMHKMLEKTTNEEQKASIKKEQLFGFEIKNYLFAIATVNMIVRGDGKSNLLNQDFFKQNPKDTQLKGITVGMINPPYSQGKKDDPQQYEISFVNHLLESVLPGGRVAAIIPQGALTGKTKDEQNFKFQILKKHTLEGVITLNKNTFYGVGVNPCIAIFTAGIKHKKDHICKFINFEKDGFEVQKHLGLKETSSAKDKKQHLLDVWFNRIKQPKSEFCVQTTITPEDEWLHSFYYFNDEIPQRSDFEKVVADYLTFEVNMITHGREYLFNDSKEKEGNSEND